MLSPGGFVLEGENTTNAVSATLKVAAHSAVGRIDLPNGVVELGVVLGRRPIIVGRNLSFRQFL